MRVEYVQVIRMNNPSSRIRLQRLEIFEETSSYNFANLHRFVLTAQICSVCLPLHGKPNTLIIHHGCIHHCQDPQSGR
jgi:hypothetical protein